ncbi:amidohydrolase family protein [Desulfovibrio litoralis]|uniref:Cytosine/adenosine deaminase n=1 Tax=Desulfovibrio litoralis DSM 11393 TaxID=1121455 RepID=A0A1M7SDJ7_9BACT|nr:amidohydrolase family protein [Desulfovibrio litoralis]SHN56580.1 Cytosine/adenosine deaminase [Desulfovibrio litoralis DSM 11393]
MMYKNTESLQVVKASRIFPFRKEKIARGREKLFAPTEVLDNAVIVAKDGCILEVETWSDFKRRANIKPYQLKDLGDVSLAPSFTNAHCHLELSHLRAEYNLGLVQGQGFVPWVKSLLIAVDQGKGLAQESYKQAISQAIDDLLISYTQAVGDINSGNCLQLSKQLSFVGINAHFFLESFGYGAESIPSFWHDLPKTWTQARTERDVKESLFQASVSGHSLYSCSIENLQKAKALCNVQNSIFSMHLAEHNDELEFLQTGKGALSELLSVRVLPKNFTPPRLSPILLADKLSLLDDKSLAVHCVHCTPSEIALMGERQVFVALCPRSNEFIGVGEVDLLALINSGVALCLGTDSIASNNDLNMLNEINALKKLAQKQKIELPLRTIIRIAALNSAYALGFIKNKKFGLGRLEKAYKFCYSIFENEN